MAFTTAETRSDIIALVVTMLDRAPDDALLNDLVTASTSGKTLDEIADMIAMTDEFTEANPASQTAEEYATEALSRVLDGTGVSADAKAGAIDLATGYLIGGMSKAELAREINIYLSNPETLLNADFGDVAQTFVNKNEVAEYYVLDADLGDLTTAELTAALAGVTAEAASVTAATEAADATAAAEDVVAGQTFTLTTGVDAETGGAADDSFIATAATVATTTLSAGDNLKGGDGTDTLSITASIAGGNTLGAGVTTSSVESLSVNAVTATTVDGSLMSGVTDVYSNGSLSDLSVTGLAAIPNTHLVGTSSDTTIGMTAATTVGTADEMTVALSSAATSSAANLTAQGIETFNVLASVASGSATTSQTLTSSSARTVAITGDASTNITVNLAGAGATEALTGSVTGNAAANTMNVTADVTDFLSVDLGAGNDILILPNGIGEEYTLAGGEGVNVLGLTQAGATATDADATISGFDVLNVINAGTGTIDMDDFEGGFTKVIYDAGLGGAATVDDAVTGVEVEVDVTAVAQNLTVDLKTDGAADAVTVTLDAIGAGDAIGTINAADAETLTVSVDDDTTTSTGTIAIAGITLGDATSVVLSGDAATTITTFTNPTTAVLTSFDASDMTDDLTMSGLNLAAAGATITLGSGDDSVTMGTGNGADTVDLSAGGDNTLVYTAVGQSDAAAMDVIKGFVSGSDDIDLTALGVTTSSLFGGVGATKTAAEGLLAGTTAPIAVFQADDNVLWVDSNGDNLLNAGDFRIEMEGLSTIAATDLGLRGAGVAISATAASAVLSTTTATNMSRVATNEGDTITSTSGFSVGSTFDGGQGTDSISFSLTAGTTTVDLDDAAGDIENIESVTIGTGITRLDLDDADLDANAAGEIATITGSSATAQTLRITAAGDFSDTAVSNIESLRAAGAVTLDAADVAAFSTQIDMAAATSDLILSGAGTFDFSTTDIADADGGADDDLIIGVNADDSDITVVADAADLAGFDEIAGDATDGVYQVLSLNDTDSFAALAVTEIDSFIIGGTAQTLTIDGDDYTTMQGADGDRSTDNSGLVVTGAGDSTLTLALGGGAAAVDFSDDVISGFATINVSAATANAGLTIDSSSIAGDVTLIADAGDALVLAEAGDYTNITVTGGDVDALTLTDGATAQTYNVTEAIFDDDHTDGTASTVVAVDGDGGAAADSILAVAMEGTTLTFAGAAFGGANGVDTTITGTSGNDVITAANSKTTGSTFSISGNGGSDQFRLEDLSGNAADGVVLADAVSITDFAAANDSVQVASADLNAVGGVPVAETSGGLDLDVNGVAYITDTSVVDFTSVAQLSAAVGNIANMNDADEFFVAVKNVDGSNVAIYNVVTALAGAETVIDAGDTVTLVAVLEVEGTFAIGNLGVY